MKRTLVSVGLVAIGASSLSVFADTYSGMGSGDKPWSVSLSLRGYYSDNIDTTAHGRDGFGFDISPSAQLHLSSAPTDFSAEYIYDAVYYDKAPKGNDGSHFDMSHTFDFNLQHQFSKRFSITVGDTFVIGQEPDQLQQVGGGFSNFQRVSGDNIHNYGVINFDAQITDLFGIELGYENSYWSYDSDKFGFHNGDGQTIGTIFGPFVPDPSTITPSLSGQDDRIEQTVHLDTHWSVSPTTVLILGYQFTDVSYISDQPIQAINPTNAVSTSNSSFQPTTPANTYKSDVRNSHSHYVYVGATHTFMPTLSGSLKVGARYTDNYNDPNGTTSLEPYVNLNLNWSYAQESYFNLGFMHDRTSNDHAGGDGSAISEDSDSSTVYALIHQRITPKLFGTLTGTFQDSVINAPGSPLDGNEDRYYIVNLDFQYKFTANFSMDAGYTYDRLDGAQNKSLTSLFGGQGDPSYQKNSVYLGATITY